MHNSDILTEVPDFSKEIPTGNRIIIDWVSFTTCKHDVVELVNLLGLAGCPFETVNGAKGYQYREYFSGISIHFSEDRTAQNGFIWLEMSGQGCRAFETYGTGDYETLFNLSRQYPEECRIKRLDVAFDDRENVFNIDQICDETKAEHFVSRLKTYEVIYSNKGNATYFGSQKSNIYIRFYDKAKERGYDNGLHWVRCELQLRDVNSQGFVNRLKDESIQDLYLGVLKNYVSFRVPDEFDSNKRRWDVAAWWDSFLSVAVPISVYDKPGVEYNLSACERYVMTQPVGSIQTLIKIYGAAAFVAMVLRAPSPKNPKYRQLIAECQQLETEESIISTLEQRVDDAEFLRELGHSYMDIEYVFIEKKEEARAAFQRRIHEDLFGKADKKPREVNR